MTYDRRTGLAHAGGYSGDGVALANLAGRTLADLVTGRDSELVRLDASERRTGRPARLLDRAMTRLTGR